MALFDGIRNRRWAYALRIAGHPYVYHCGPQPPSDAMPDVWTEDGPSWAPVRAIKHVGSYSESLPQLGGIGKQSPIAITLSAGGDWGQHPGSPGRCFARLGVRSAEFWGLVVAFEIDGGGPILALPATAAAPIVVTLDRAVDPALSYPRVVHIGQEAFIASEAAGDAITLTARAIGGTIARTHTVRLVTRDQPVLTTSDVVFWRSRRAVLVGYRVEGGGVGTAVEVMRGFIERTPEISDDGLSVTVQLVPLIALLGQGISIPVSSTRLVRGLHYFSPPHACSIATTYRVPQWRGHPSADAIAGDGEVEVEPDDLAQWVATFDPTLPDTNPRAGSISLRRDQRDTRGGIASVGAGPPRLIFDDEDAPYGAGIASVGDLRTLETYDYASIEIIADEIVTEPGLLRWPGDEDDEDFSWLGKLHASPLGTTDDHTGVDGRWARMTLAAGAVTWTSTTHPEGLAPVCGVVSGPADRAFISEFAIGWPSEEATEAGGGYLESSPARLGLVWEYPMRDADEGTVTYPHSGFALAWYYRGESHFLIRDAIDVSRGTVRITGRETDGTRLNRIIAVHPALTEVEVGAIGSTWDGETLYLVSPLDPDGTDSFGEWVDTDRIEVRIDLPGFATSGQLIEYFLTDPDHLALGADDLDIGSILADGAEPPWVRLWGTPETDESLTYSSIIDGILKASRSALVMATGADGCNRVTRVPVGVERIDRIAAIIGQGDWAAGTTPSFGTDDKLINRLTVRAHVTDQRDADATEPEYDWSYEKTHQSKTSQRLFEEVASDDIDLYAALNIDRDDPALEGFGALVMRAYEQPRRVWRGRVGTYLGLRAHLGGTVQVTSRHLRNYYGDSVIEELGTVVERQIDLWAEGVTLRMAHAGATANGWNAGMKVATVVDAVTVTVEANAYSDPSYPTEDGSPYEDLTPFEVAMSVRCVPVVDQDAAVLRVITAIDREDRKITFSVAHGMAVGDIITPPSYTQDGNEIFRVYAYLAGSDGTLGELVDDPGHTYV